MASHRDTHQRNVEIVRRFDEGQTIEELAEQYSVSSATIVGALKKAGRDIRANRKPAAVSPRDAEILRRWSEDYDTYEEIGEHFGVSRQRIEQILSRLDAPDAKTIAVLRANKKDAARRAEIDQWDERIGHLIEPLIRSQLPAEEIAERLSLVAEPVEAADVSDYARRHGMVLTYLVAPVAFPESAIIVALQAAAAKTSGCAADDADRVRLTALELRELQSVLPRRQSFLTAAGLAGAARHQTEPLRLTVNDYQRWRVLWNESEPEATDKVHPWPPTVATINRRIGGGYWNGALQRSGLAQGEGSRGRGTVVYSEDVYEETIARFVTDLDAIGMTPTIARYDTWSEGQTVPSGASIRNYFGSWSNAQRKGYEISGLRRRS